MKPRYLFQYFFFVNTKSKYDNSIRATSGISTIETLVIFHILTLAKRLIIPQFHFSLLSIFLSFGIVFFTLQFYNHKIYMNRKDEFHSKWVLESNKFRFVFNIFNVFIIVVCFAAVLLYKYL
jgi:hypothetical protein